MKKWRWYGLETLEEVVRECVKGIGGGATRCEECGCYKHNLPECIDNLKAIAAPRCIHCTEDIYDESGHVINNDYCPYCGRPLYL